MNAVRFLVITLILFICSNINAFSNEKTPQKLTSTYQNIDSLVEYLKKSTSMKKVYINDIQKIIALANSSNNKKLKAEGYFLLAKYEFTLNNQLEKATRHLILSYSLYDSLKDENGKMDVNLQLGLIQYSIKDYIEAINYFNKISINKKNNDKQKATAIYLSALSYSELNQFNKAIIYFDDAIRIYKIIGNDVGVNMCEMFKGKMYVNNKEYQRAVEHLKNTIGIPKSKSDSFMYSPAFAFISTAYYQLNDFENSINSAETAFRFMKNVDGSLVYVKEALTSLHKSYKAIGSYSKAYICLEKLNNINDSVLNIDILNGISKIKSQYEYQQKLNKAKLEQVKKDLIIKQEMAFQKQVRNSLLVVFSVVLIFTVVIYIQRNKINKSKKRSDELLLNILPVDVAEELKIKGYADAKLFENVTVLFTDFKGFTEISQELTPKELVEIINEHFSEFDRIMLKYGIEKIKTIGDAYMAVGGLPIENNTNAKDVINAAIEIQNYLSNLNKIKKANNEPFFEARIGIHSGSVVAGIVGLKKFSYDVWGDTVNTASRMENNCEVGKINISESTYELVKNDYTFEFRGNIEVKGKGLINMYYVKNS